MSAIKRAAVLGAAGWMVLLPAGPALTQALCTGTLQTFSQAAAAGTQTGSLQSFVVPAGVSTVRISAAGAQGGQGQQPGGMGALVVGDYTVAPGDRLCILVGVSGGPATFTGGGGGASSVFAGSAPSCDFAQASLSSLLVSAAGGGGGGFAGSGNPGHPGLGTGLQAGAAGALSGGDSVHPGGTGGNGGSAAAHQGSGGGLSGAGDTRGGGSGCEGGGAIISGATGGPNCNGGWQGAGGFGGGGSGGGGGGYNGGSAIGSTGDRNGGGGSFSSVTPVSAQDGARSGNGEVSFCYTVVLPAPVPTLTEWAMIGLTGLLALCGLAIMDRRRRFPASID